MLRPAGFYKRRLPWIGQPLHKAAAVPPKVIHRPLVVNPAKLSRGGQMVRFRPPPAPRPVTHKVIRPLVIHPGYLNRGGQLKRFAPPGSIGVIQQRPPHAMVTELPRRPPPGQGRVYMTRVFGLPPAVPPLSTAPRFYLSARADNQVVLRASVGTQLSLQASALTSWVLRVGRTMSISAKLNFFQGEDVTLTFSMTPPQDITGWTLTCTVKNQLGGTTQFTVTPTILDTGRGVFQAVWGRSNTSGLTPGDYVWDVRRTDTNNNTVLAHGEATVKQPVTS
jgi:hypothetical protein